MSENHLIFTYKNEDMIVQCSNEEKMKDIFQRFSKKINKDLNSLKFLLGGNQINFELTFKEQISLIEKRDDKMKILVYINEEKDRIYPYSEEKSNNFINGIIEINSNEINTNIILFNTAINDGINVYINNQKINITKENNKSYYKFNKIGKYIFKIIFKDIINNCFISQTN